MGNDVESNESAIQLTSVSFEQPSDHLASLQATSNETRKRGRKPTLNQDPDQSSKNGNFD